MLPPAGLNFVGRAMNRSVSMATRRAGVLSLFLGASLVALGAAVASAADIKPAIVYDIGGKFDKSFNEGVFHGAEKFKSDTGIDFRDFEVTNDAQREQALRRFAKDGFSPIIAVGFGQAEPLTKVAAEFPNTKFAIIDSVVDKPNVQSVTFKEEQGSFLVGLLAAKASKTRQGRLRGRHGHPAHPQIRLRLRTGREIRQSAGRGVPEHDRHHGRGLA